jgi:excisionase family DNA binding protein
MQTNEEGRTNGDVEPDGSQRLLRVKDVARLLGFHEKTIYLWVERGVFPCIRIGKRLRFAASDVSRWLQARKGGT